VASLKAALTDRLIWSLVEEKPGPKYRVPSAIQYDLFLWKEVDGKEKAYKAIQKAVEDVVNKSS